MTGKRIKARQRILTRHVGVCVRIRVWVRANLSLFNPGDVNLACRARFRDFALILELLLHGEVSDEITGEDNTNIDLNQYIKYILCFFCFQNFCIRVPAQVDAGAA